MFYPSQLKTAQLHSILSSSKSSWSIHATWGQSVFSHGKGWSYCTHTHTEDFDWHELGLWKSLILKTLAIDLTIIN